MLQSKAIPRGGVWCQVASEHFRPKKYIQESITYGLALYFRCPVHVIGCYLPAELCDRANKLVNHVDWIVRRIIGKFRRSRIMVLGDLNMHREAIALRLEPHGLV